MEHHIQSCFPLISNFPFYSCFAFCFCHICLSGYISKWAGKCFLGKQWANEVATRLGDQVGKCISPLWCFNSVPHHVSAKALCVFQKKSTVTLLHTTCLQLFQASDSRLPNTGTGAGPNYVLLWISFQSFLIILPLWCHAHHCDCRSGDQQSWPCPVPLEEGWPSILACWWGPAAGFLEAKCTIPWQSLKLLSCSVILKKGMRKTSSNS